MYQFFIIETQLLYLLLQIDQKIHSNMMFPIFHK